MLHPVDSYLSTTIRVYLLRKLELRKGDQRASTRSIVVLCAAGMIGSTYRLPSIDMPDIDMPDIDMPRIPLPCHPHHNM
jgi:hypothetical protein